VGAVADVTVDGTAGTIEGTVAQVGPVQSSTSGYSYPVVVVLPASANNLFSGSSANVSIVTGAKKDVLAVPTSAVIAAGTQSYVQVLSGATWWTRRSRSHRWEHLHPGALGTAAWR